MATKQPKRLPPIHPGEILQELLLESGLTANALALALRVPANRIGGIVKGQRGITPDTALRLGRFFGMSSEFWLGLQMDYELETESDRLKDRLEKEVSEYHATG